MTTATVRGSQMEPTVGDGERILVRRKLTAPRLTVGLPPPRGSVVVLDVPHRKRTRICLRVVARPGDSVMISDGHLLSPHGVSCSHSSEPVIPAEYSPRDFAQPYRIPYPGDLLLLDSLSPRDFIFVASMQAQQDPASRYDVSADLFIDRIPSNEYFVSNFFLYQGPFNAIPDSMDFDWFFWDRLIESLRRAVVGRTVDIRWTLLRDGEPMTRVTIKRVFVYVLADNWARGADSRYFGPVCISRIRGIAWRIYWSALYDGGRWQRVRWERIGRNLGCPPES